MTYLTDKVALDITAGAPNNGRGENNVGVVKKLSQAAVVSQVEG